MFGDKLRLKHVHRYNLKWLRYYWNIVESGVKHHKPSLPEYVKHYGAVNLHRINFRNSFFFCENTASYMQKNKFRIIYKIITSLFAILYYIEECDVTSDNYIFL